MQRHVEQKNKVAETVNRNVRRTSAIKPTKAFLQVLETRAKEDAAAHAEATENQVMILAQGRVSSSVAAERRGDRRSRRMSVGLDAMIAAEATVELFKAKGTFDDAFRPENNAAGHIAPSEREMVASVLARAEKERVEKVLREHTSPPELEPTQPRSPRPGLSQRTITPITLTQRETPEGGFRSASPTGGVRSTAGYVVPDISTRAAGYNWDLSGAYTVGKAANGTASASAMAALKSVDKPGRDRSNLALCRSLEYPIEYPQVKGRSMAGSDRSTLSSPNRSERRSRHGKQKAKLPSKR